MSFDLFIHFFPSETLTRLIYTINFDSFKITQPLSNSINLPNVYMGIPYKQYTIYLENKLLNTTLLSMINKALRLSWAKANNYLFSSNDLFIPSINNTLTE